MTESAREEALRLAREAGFFPEISNDPNSPPSWWTAGHDPQFMRLIALARQRPGWVWVPDKGSDAIFVAGMSYDSRFTRLLVEAMWKSMLAAAPKPEEGT
jgi:hypothetical protein